MPLVRDGGTAWNKLSTRIDPDLPDPPESFESTSIALEEGSWRAPFVDLEQGLSSAELSLATLRAPDRVSASPRGWVRIEAADGEAVEYLFEPRSPECPSCSVVARIVHGDRARLAREYPLLDPQIDSLLRSGLRRMLGYGQSYGSLYSTSTPGTLVLCDRDGPVAVVEVYDPSFERHGIYTPREQLERELQRRIQAGHWRTAMHLAQALGSDCSEEGDETRRRVADGLGSAPAGFFPGDSDEAFRAMLTLVQEFDRGPLRGLLDGAMASVARSYYETTMANTLSGRLHYDSRTLTALVQMAAAAPEAITPRRLSGYVELAFNRTSPLGAARTAADRLDLLERVTRAERRNEVFAAVDGETIASWLWTRFRYRDVIGDLEREDRVRAIAIVARLLAASELDGMWQEAFAALSIEDRLALARSLVDALDQQQGRALQDGLFDQFRYSQWEGSTPGRRAEFLELLERERPFREEQLARLRGEELPDLDGSSSQELPLARRLGFYEAMRGNSEYSRERVERARIALVDELEELIARRSKEGALAHAAGLTEFALAFCEQGDYEQRGRRAAELLRPLQEQLAVRLDSQAAARSGVALRDPAPPHAARYLEERSTQPDGIPVIEVRVAERLFVDVGATLSVEDGFHEVEESYWVESEGDAQAYDSWQAERDEATARRNAAVARGQQYARSYQTNVMNENGIEADRAYEAWDEERSAASREQLTLGLIDAFAPPPDLRFWDSVTEKVKYPYTLTSQRWSGTVSRDATLVCSDGRTKNVLISVPWPGELRTYQSGVPALGIRPSGSMLWSRAEAEHAALASVGPQVEETFALALQEALDDFHASVVDERLQEHVASATFADGRSLDADELAWRRFYFDYGWRPLSPAEVFVDRDFDFRERAKPAASAERDPWSEGALTPAEIRPWAAEEHPFKVHVSRATRVARREGRSCSWSPDGERFVLHDDRAVTVYSLTGEPLETYGFESINMDRPMLCAFAEDGEGVLLVARAKEEDWAPQAVYLYRLDASGCHLLHTAEKNRFVPHFVEPTATWPRRLRGPWPTLVPHGPSRSVLWQETKWDLIFSRPDGHVRLLPNAVRGSFSGVLSPDGEYIAASPNNRRQLVVWDRQGRVIRVYEHGEGMPQNGVHFASDGRRIFTWSEELLRCWSFPEGRELWSLTRERVEAPFVNVGFSVDDRYLACGKRRITVFDLGIGRRIGRVDSDSNAERELVFGPDGSRLCEVFGDGVVLWSLATE